MRLYVYFIKLIRKKFKSDSHPYQIIDFLDELGCNKINSIRIYFLFLWNKRRNLKNGYLYTKPLFLYKVDYVDEDLMPDNNSGIFTSNIYSSQYVSTKFISQFEEKEWSNNNKNNLPQPKIKFFDEIYGDLLLLDCDVKILYNIESISPFERGEIVRLMRTQIL